MNRSIRTHIAHVLSLCLAAAAASTNASTLRPALRLAQSAEQAAVLVPVDIGSQPLSDALNAFARQTGLQVVIDWKDSTGITAPKVQGKMTTDEALAKLLEKSGLEYQFINDRTVAVRAKTRSSATLSDAASLRLAQNVPAAQGSSQISSSEQPSELSEVTVSANYVPETNNSAAKMDISLLETPQSVSVITRDQIELLNLQNVEQAVRYTSGIVSGAYGDDSRYDWFTLRGFSPTKYLDGLQLPTGSFAASRMDLSALESIEILKGPSSGLYGAVPPGGLVNMVSRRPRSDFGAQLGVQAGSFDHFQANGEVTGPVNAAGTVRYRLGGVYQDSSSIIEKAPPTERVMVQPSLTWQPNDRFSVTMLSQFQDDDMGVDQQFLPEIGTALPNPNGKLPRSTYVSDPNYDAYKRNEQHVGYVLDYKISDRLKLHQGVRKSDIEIKERMLYGIGTFEDAEQRRLQRFQILFDENQGNVATDTSLQLDFRTGALAHKLLAGVDHRVADTSYTFGYDLEPPSIDVYNPVYGLTFADPAPVSRTAVDETQTGLYLQDHAKIANWVFTGTLRRDEYDSDSLERLDGSKSRFDQQATTGRAGVNYLFDSGVSPYVSYSKSFEPQSGFDGITGKPFVPTTGKQYEVGVKYQPRGKNGLISLIAYDLRQQNVPTAVPGLWIYEQVGEVQVKGVELEGVARLNDAFSINGAYSYMDATVSKSKDPAELGTRIPQVPKNQASLLLDYTLRLPSGSYLGFGGGVRYQGEAFGSRGELGFMSANTQVDALFRYGRGPWRFTLNVNNLFDVKYLATCDGYGSCFYGYSRMVMGTLTRDWGKTNR